MLITDGRYLSYTDPSELAEMKAVAQFPGIRIHFTNLMQSEAGINYFRLSPKIKSRRMQWFNQDNCNKKPEHTIIKLPRESMDKHLAGKRIGFSYFYNFPKLFKSGLHYEVFEALFGKHPISEINITPQGANKRLMRWHGQNTDEYLLLYNKGIAYAEKDKNVVPIDQKWLTLLKAFAYIKATSKPRPHNL